MQHSVMYFPTHPARTTYGRLVQRSTTLDTSAIPNPGFGSLLQFSRGKVCPGSLREKYLWILIQREATGSRRYTQHFTCLSRGSDHVQILTSPRYPRRLAVSGLYENGFNGSATTLAMAPQDQWTTSDNGSWLHARWPSTLIERVPVILSLIGRCAA